MPLEPYRRGATWWAKGRVEYLGKPITDYYRNSTGASEEAGAWAWCRDEEERRINEHLLGANKTLSFAEAVMLYPANNKTATYLIPITEKWGSKKLSSIAPKDVRQLARELYPNASTDTWTRQVITPVRSVINNFRDGDSGDLFHVKGFSKQDRLKQDKRRGKKSRVKKEPGSWEWLLKFRQHAGQRHAALALTMFVTGARISQAISMHPKLHCRLDEGQICIPGAKGHDDRWLDIPKELVDELKALPVLYPRGAERKAENLRLFGFADRSSPRKGWAKACEDAKIPFIPFHAAGRHGFGQEMNIRQSVDEKAAGAFGGWADTALMKRTYTHAEEVSGKVHEAFYRGLKEAEKLTRIKLASGGKSYKPRTEAKKK
ncbi:tyrosine-type recombinase/integrase [Sphingobium phenoxybenzoativorans]|uniref:Tyrosine-type recombinase/integrase n=1 Tax=Sphingobium phenoxybenzoativorans TaxID=1592790 RepID=A0A975KBP6_9SPHN|nr:tyrosine-type recombinase/integrase [Sphingobium phenoxybenzoativorans]QUT07969.1 tyrosine-type recombinase/integrase [Sphingobium phenoxybenzoativorans]